MRIYTVVLPFVGAITIELRGNLSPFLRPIVESGGQGELVVCTGKVKLYLTRWSSYQRVV